ncbi:MAG TPA: hypothetical protein PK414_05130 [Anaerolineales bacterium]|nr:hypothetical protein [Anaerolineales bacterium]HNB35580.1 hypothetical protein [Anaerolineales bacterium]HNC07170.1 hypothetical protein [Anaerolineales bacterium]
MNHQPFETWLLDDKHLTTTEKRELDAHLRECRTCSALAETGLVLRSTRVAAPRPGFALRFQHRLAEQKALERRRRTWGLFLLVSIGVGAFSWFVAPYVIKLATSPFQWFISITGYFLYALTSLKAIGEILTVLARVVPDLLPPYAWMVLISAFAGMGLLWMVSIWRFARRAQGVLA